VVPRAPHTTDGGAPRRPACSAPAGRVRRAPAPEASREQGVLPPPPQRRRRSRWILTSGKSEDTSAGDSAAQSPGSEAPAGRTRRLHEQVHPAR